MAELDAWEAGELHGDYPCFFGRIRDFAACAVARLKRVKHSEFDPELLLPRQGEASGIHGQVAVRRIDRVAGVRIDERTLRQEVFDFGHRAEGFDVLARNDRLIQRAYQLP